MITSNAGRNTENKGTSQNRSYTKRDNNDNSRRDQTPNKSYKPRNQSGGSRNENGYGRPYRKKEDDNRGRDFRNNKSSGKDFRPKTEVKEQQPDKVEIINRLEKEKKVMKKKTEKTANKKEVNSRPQVRQKRQNNIDWTREYENDSYDDMNMMY